jgi:hypothetical protein
MANVVDDRERERMVEQVRRGEVVSATEESTIYRNPSCPWCQEPFDSEKWELEPMMAIPARVWEKWRVMGEHEAACPRCGFIARFRPRKEA